MPLVWALVGLFGILIARKMPSKEHVLRRAATKPNMIKKLATAFVSFFFLIGAQAANWYVRPNGAGAKTGADWNNAWDCGDTGGIVWSSLSGGDTVWFAGGTYNKHIHPTKSGSAGNLITLKRVLASDAVPVAAAGWSAGFDSQVIIQPGDSALYWDTPNVGSYLYIDGRQ